ncbi:MAG: acetyltransferase [Massilibacteroides sp.]|nr:acetyltransferase [Massilibacteroides sp.]MDD3062265.1 acetyltransferase [Massilibacteroides sp.]MDD4113996.1 acetyltransferase [Massilibacteroides sp.]MDD4660038.1 acetyltransferase [Massilibacteroides sp.]
MRPLILIGGGGHCKSVIDVAECAGYTIKGILDVPENVGKTILNYQIIGTDDDIKIYIANYDFLITVGFIKDPILRLSLHEKITSLGGRLATLIAPSAHVSQYAKLGIGTVVMHKAMINASAEIGKGCIINTYSNVEHDVTIEDYCHISTGTMINGNCRVGEKTFIGSQSVLVNGVSIVSGCIIGAGSVVRKNIIKKGIYSGNPALLKIQL